MFLSMTGFGRASRLFPWGTVTFELASVNHRYLEIGVRLPKEIASLESGFVALLRSSLKRGKVKLGAEIEWTPEYRALRVDTEVLSAYFRQMQSLSDHLNVPPPDSLTPFLSLPGVCDSLRAVAEEEADDIWGPLLREAVEALNEMKRSEGAKLQQVVEKDLMEFESLAGTLSARWERAAPEAFDALKGRIEKVMERFDLEIDQARISQEVSIIADKWDVSEELTRLSAHISKFREIAFGKESEGRKLDFLIQEMNREVNTMGSKVGDAEFRWCIVDAKSCLERIREQVQNIE